MSGKFILIDNNTRDKYGALNLLRSFIFANEPINRYDPNKVYNKNDLAYYVDNNTSNIVIITAKADNITGPLNLRYWSSTSLTNTIMNNLDKIVHIGPKQPTDDAVKIWVTPISYRQHTLPDPYEPEIPDIDYTKLNIVFTDNAVPVVDDPETELEAGFYGLVIDRESVSVTSNVDTSFNTAETVIIDEQEDIHTHDDAPPENDPALLWFDTDLTDDN